MAILLACPICGERNVDEFRNGGEMTTRPLPSASKDEWTRYLYMRANVAGEQQEWWYHTLGCRRWFMAVRNTVTNHVHETSWPNELRL